MADIAAALSGDEASQGDLSIGRRRRGLRFGKLRGLAKYDAADLYRQPKPTWVAAALMEWQLVTG